MLQYSIEGVGEILTRLQKISAGITTTGSDEALIEAANLVVADAKRLVPVRTGALKRNIDRTAPRKGRSFERVIHVGVRPPISRRAHFTEFGTVHNSAQPFLRPALDANSRPATSVMARILNSFMTAFAGGATAAPKTRLDINLGQ